MKAAALVQHHGNPSICSCSAFSSRSCHCTDIEWTIKDIPSIIPHLRVLNFNPTWGLGKNWMIRAIHRPNDGGEMFTVQRLAWIKARISPDSNLQNSHINLGWTSKQQTCQRCFSQTHNFRQSVSKINQTNKTSDNTLIWIALRITV